MYLQILSYRAMVWRTSSVISLGCEVENLTRSNGLTWATRSNRLAKFNPSYLYESTFCPNSVTSRYPALKRSAASLTIECGSRLRSRPRVKGTTQKEHMLSQPRMMEINAVTPLVFRRTGLISAYVSSRDSNTLTAREPSSTCSMRLGRSRYASGPTTTSTNFSSSRNLDFRRSAMHPKTPTTIPGFFCLADSNSFNRLRTRCSAFSRIEHVLMNTTSASL